METVKRGYVPKDTKVFPEQRYAVNGKIKYTNFRH